MVLGPLQGGFRRSTLFWLYRMSVVIVVVAAALMRISLSKAKPTATATHRAAGRTSMLCIIIDGQFSQL